MDSRGVREIAAAKSLPTLKQGESGLNSLKSRREKERKKSYTQKEKFLMFTR